MRVRHLLQYLHHTVALVLEYHELSDETRECPVLDLYTDASLSPTGDKSHQAMVLKLEKSVVTWASGRQSLTALSSAEAELIAAIYGIQLALPMCTTLSEMSLRKTMFRLHVDNAAVVDMSARSTEASSRTRHLAMRASYLKDVRSLGYTVQHVDTTNQCADCLTKGMACTEHIRNMIGLTVYS